MSRADSSTHKFAKAKIGDLSGELLEIANTFLADWEKDTSTGLILSGAYGVGKSYTAAAVLNHIRFLKPAKWDTLFITSPRVYEAYYDITKREHWDDYRDQMMAVTLESVDVLVWNDLGKENRTGGYLDQVIYCFGRLLRERVERGLSTIFTTNLRIDPKVRESIKSSYGDGFWSLIHEAAPLRFEVQGSDKRRQK